MVEVARLDDLLSPADVARLAGISPQTVRVHAFNGDMPREVRRVAGARIWLRSDIEAWLRERARRRAARKARTST